MHRGYFVGLGSNVDAYSNIGAAIGLLLARFGRIDVSRVLETAPVGPMRGSFLNTVAFLHSDMPAERLKELFCSIEAGLGRDRSHPDRAVRDRTIDLDILAELPAGSLNLEASSIPPEPYYRPSVLELAHTLGLACPVPAAPTTGAVAVPLGGGREQIGLEPVVLAQDRPGEAVAVGRRRAALVTGGAVRLGREIAHSLARAGYDIALHYNASEVPAERTAEELRGLGVRCEAFRCDFRSADGLPALVDAVVARFPHAELLVNSASVYESGTIAETSPELLQRQWAVNFQAPFLLMKEFCARVERGAVVNILDNKIAFNQFTYAAYLGSKKALAEATKMAALEYAPRFRVNGLAPGVVMPAESRGEAYLGWRKEGIPSARLGSAGELCDGLRLLAENDFVNGQILFVDGGESTSFVGRNAPAFAPGANKKSSPPMAAE